MIAILGGGVAGVSTARSLALRGARDVVVFDPRQPGQGSTGAALGGFRTQHGSAINVALSLASREYFAQRADRVGFQPVGYLYVAETPAAAGELAARAQVQRELGLPIEHPSPKALVPFLETGDLLGANYCALDGVYLPPLVLGCYVEEARSAGAELRYGQVAAPVELERADAVVVAAGAWSAEAGRQLGVELAVTPLERAIFQIGPFDWLPPRVPVTLEAGSGYHFRERDGRLLLTGPGDQHAYDHFLAWLERRAPRAAVPDFERHWTGNYEMTADHHPLVGETERPGVWACCGFSGHGVMHSPAVGESLAAMILGETPPVDISALSPLRTEPLVDRTQL
ncbi:MAG TPA: FAD-binding oxidoreductase [Candidatus Dormibacteraeota bacterium]